GAFLGCSNYPACKNTRPLSLPANDQGQAQMAGPRELGTDPATGLPVSARVGPYGAYVQLGPKPEAPAPEAEEEPTDGKKKKAKKKKSDAPKPKRVSLPKKMDPNLIDLDTALKLLALPREVGKHPETGEMITAAIGRFGPYIKMGTTYKTIPAEDDVLSIGLNRAVALLAEPSKGRFGKPKVAGKALGEHPEDKKPVTLNSGRFGPYVKWGKVMATVTKAYDPETLTLDQAVEIIAAKIAKGPSTKGKGKKAAAKDKTEKEPKKPSKTKKAKEE
ncbi:MAG: topoisomerase C-terminal repeat-containing protein, partial [Alphaproteobacteria bacterium]|nr:topoisomerase C-terminal repeat-containing protein [Alphaproteobacteria bacterium]